MHPSDPSPGAADFLAYARDGDAAALERCLRACADQAYTQARRTLGNPADADDAVQEAFLQLVRTAGRFDGTVPFGAWLGQLVRTACLRVRRSERRRQRREEVAMATPSTPQPDTVDAEAVRALVARLPAADRAAIELHYFAGLSQAETAAALGGSESSVAMRLSRARARLRGLLGGGASLAVVAALLAAQPAYAAPPQVLAGIAPLTLAVAAGAALPATTVPLSALQKGLLFMSTHPVAAAAILLAVLGAGLLPVALVAGEARPAPPAAVAGPQPWQGKARALLPFLDPAAPVQLAVDVAHVRQLALAAKPTSLLADPRTQPALAHIREQFRLWRAAGGGAPNWAQVITEAEGAVLGASRQSKHCFVAELGAPAASQVQGMFEESYPIPGSPRRAAEVGGFSGFLSDRGILGARDGGRWALAEPGLLAAGLARRTSAIPPAGLWARIDLADGVAQLARMDPVADPLALGSLLGDGWRRLRPQLACSLSTAKGAWRAETRLTGAGRLPLRPVQPGIAGCVPADAAASLLLGCDPERLGAAIAPYIEPRALEALLAQVRRSGIEPAALPGQLSGDLAVVMRQRMPLPEFGLVLGLRPGAAAALRGGLDKLAAAAGLVGEPAVAPALAAWSGVLPIGAVQMRLAADRLVVSTGEAAALLAPPPRQVDAAVAIDADLPALARTWLPQLLALVPAKPLYFDEGIPLVDVVQVLINQPGVNFPDPNLDLERDLVALDGFPDLPKAWRRLVGKDLPLKPHVAVYNSRGNGDAQVVLRCADGWRVVGWRLRTYEVVADRAALARRLAGLELRAGTPAADLAQIVISEPPSIDPRWLPPLPAILDHLPAYRLRLQPTADGFALIEDGVPLAGPFLLAMSTWIQSEPITRLRGEAVLRRDGAALRQRHARAIAALRRTAKALESRSSQAAALMTPSAVLAAAGTDPAELASLCDGAVPDAARLDRLGFFHPSAWPHQHFSWLFPLADGLFLECHWASPAGCDIVSVPYTPQRLPSAEELARLRSAGGGGAAAPAPAPAPPPRASDF